MCTMCGAIRLALFRRTRWMLRQRIAPPPPPPVNERAAAYATVERALRERDRLMAEPPCKTSSS